MTVNSEKVLNYMKEHYGEELTKKDIAEALEVPFASVTGSMNALIKKGYAVTTRKETVEDAPATETRKAYDPVAEEARKVAEKKAAKAARAAERAAQKAAKEAAAE